MTAGGLPPADLAEVARALADACGLSLASGLAPTLRDGVAGAADALGVAEAELATRVRARDAAALEALVAHSVVVETSFHRHPEGLAALVARLAPTPGPLRIWSAGCATGEEPYGLAMALLDAGRAGRGDAILGTDVSPRALLEARLATYGARTLRRVPKDALARWFEGDGPWRARDAVRALVELRRHNLLADPPPGTFDAVVCRNVLIYFEPAAAAEVLYRLAGAVRPGGFLLLGPVELPLATAMPFEWIREEGATVLRRPER